MKKCSLFQYKKLGAELFQLSGMFALIEAALWTTGPLRILFTAVVAIGCLIVLCSQGSNPARTDISPGAWNWTLKIAFTTSIIILGVGLAAGWLHKPTSRWPVVIGSIFYLFWAALQQFVLQSFFFVRLQRLLGDSRFTIVVCALLFCLAHLPSIILVIATFFAALFFCESFRRFRTIYPIAVAHSMLALALSMAVPERLLRQMRVGATYLHFH
jgi:hypothetical protein